MLRSGDTRPALARMAFLSASVMVEMWGGTDPVGLVACCWAGDCAGVAGVMEKDGRTMPVCLDDPAVVVVVVALDVVVMGAVVAVVVVVVVVVLAVVVVAAVETVFLGGVAGRVMTGGEVTAAGRKTGWSRDQVVNDRSPLGRGGGRGEGLGGRAARARAKLSLIGPIRCTPSLVHLL